MSKFNRVCSVCDADIPDKDFWAWTKVSDIELIGCQSCNDDGAFTKVIDDVWERIHNKICNEISNSEENTNKEGI